METDPCSIVDCGQYSTVRGWCKMHYGRWYRNGSPHFVKYERRKNGDLLNRNNAGEKFCRKCEKWVPVASFWKSKYTSDGLCYYCRYCISADARNYKYGIDVSELLRDQDFRCGICNTEINESSAHVDHDHVCCPGQKTCGKCVRGLLCVACNKGLGFFRDSTENLSNAVKYLEQF